MQRSGSQKVLLVLSIISIVFAVLGLLASIVLIAGGALFSAVPAQEATEALSGSGITQGEASAVVGISGVVVLLACAFELLVGILGVRAANDNQKIMPVWILAIIDIILYVVNLVYVFMSGTFQADGLTGILSLLVACAMFWIANNIKKEAGK